MRFLSNKKINLFLSIKKVYSVFFCPLTGYLGKGLPELRSVLQVVSLQRRFTASRFATS